MGLSRVLAVLAALLGGLGMGEALADQPRAWEMGLQAPATVVMERIEDFHGMMLWIITIIAVFVLGLLIYVIVRFNERVNPSPTKTHHNTVLEVLWTAVPILVLASIVVPSLKLLYFGATIPKPEMTIKAIGHQWYWSYEYPDNGNFTFDALMTADKDLKPGQPRLLETDNHLVIPVNTKVRILITASDVIHSFAVPAFGLKLDGEPGRVNETWFKVEQAGVYYGQCSQLCGNGHGYMPIMIQALSKADFQAWVEQAKKKFAKADEGAAGTQVAALPAN